MVTVLLPEFSPVIKMVKNFNHITLKYYNNNCYWWAILVKHYNERRNTKTQEQKIVNCLHLCSNSSHKYRLIELVPESLSEVKDHFKILT